MEPYTLRSDEHTQTVVTKHTTSDTIEYTIPPPTHRNTHTKHVYYPLSITLKQNHLHKLCYNRNICVLYDGRVIWVWSRATRTVITSITLPIPIVIDYIVCTDRIVSWCVCGIGVYWIQIRQYTMEETSIIYSIDIKSDIHIQTMVASISDDTIQLTDNNSTFTLTDENEWRLVHVLYASGGIRKLVCDKGIYIYIYDTHVTHIRSDVNVHERIEYQNVIDAYISSSTQLVLITSDASLLFLTYTNQIYTLSKQKYLNNISFTNAMSTTNKILVLTPDYVQIVTGEFTSHKIPLSLLNT